MKQTFAVMIFLAVTAQAQVRETQTMREVAQEVGPGTLVVFDIDNTLLESAQTLGSDQWFDAHIEELTEKYSDKEKAFNETSNLWIRLQQVTNMQPVEAITPSLVRNLQNRGIVVMALTARPWEVASVTNEHLNRAGIDLTRTSPKAEVEHYTNGIVFAGRAKKGDVLKSFLAEVGLSPRKIVFVDDKAKHTVTVDASLSTLDVPHIEFRYGAADPKVYGYDKELAAIQLQHFGGILSDSVAAKLRE